MPNSGIIGRSLYGKTTLLKIILRRAKNDGRTVGVLDVTNDAEFEEFTDFLTDDPEQFEKVFWETKDIVWGVDEGGEVAGRKNEAMKWAAVRGRHQIGPERKGHSIFFVAHRWTLLDPTLRAQITEIFVFSSALDDAKDLADQFGAEELRNAPGLDIGEFYHVAPGKGCSMWHIDFENMKIIPGHKSAKV